MTLEQLPRPISKSAAARVGVALLAISSLTACKKEQKLPPKTVFVAAGPKCPLVTLAHGAVATSAWSSGSTGDTRVMSVYEDGRIVSTGRKNGDHDVPAALDPDRVARFEADLVATGVFALKPGCWVLDPPPGQAYDSGGRSSTWRHDGGPWGSWARAYVIPPALAEALRLDDELWREVMKITDKIREEDDRALLP